MRWGSTPHQLMEKARFSRIPTCHMSRRQAQRPHRLVQAKDRYLDMPPSEFRGCAACHWQCDHRKFMLTMCFDSLYGEKGMRNYDLDILERAKSPIQKGSLINISAHENCTLLSTKNTEINREQALKPPALFQSAASFRTTDRLPESQDFRFVCFRGRDDSNWVLRHLVCLNN